MKMKFTLSFKTPDVLDQLNEVIDDQDERDAAAETAKKFLRYSEYISVEFDTDTETAAVLAQS